MRFGSVCSGIEAASVAFVPLGWKSAWLAEIESFPCAVLAHHYPDVPNLGDMTRIASMVEAGQIEAPDMLCGGTPCQSFSVAGQRRSLDDARGNLSLEFIRTADAIDRIRRAAGKRPAYVLWENVPGVLSTKDNAFGAFLGGLCGSDSAVDEPADGWPSAGVVDGPARAVAWRTLDAQFFGLAQRRKRVFVLALGGSGRWACADALLPVGEGVRGDSAPRREAWQRVAPTIAGCASADHAGPAGPAGSGISEDGISFTLTKTDVHAICFDTTQITSKANYSNPQPGDACHPLAAGGHAPAIAFDTYNHTVTGDVTQTLCSRGDTPGGTSHVVPAIAFDCKASGQSGFGVGEIASTQRAMGHANSHTNGGGHQAVMSGTQVRRLTPRECERLMGFPDGYTLIPFRGKSAADGPRYKALGNSWAVPVVTWIGRRIQAVEAGASA